MKEIIIKIENKEKIEKMLNDVQEKSKVRIIYYKDIAAAIEKVENQLRLPKKYLNGVKISVDCNAQAFPRSYKYEPISSIFNAENRNGKWYLTDVYRGRCREQFNGYRIFLTNEAISQIIKRYEEPAMI